MAVIVKIPTAATSFYTVRKSGKAWAVVLVTPCGSKNLATKLCTFADQAAAIDYAKAAADRAQRPFKQRGAA